MSKRTAILFIVVLALGIVFNGQAEAKVVVKQNPASVNVAATLEVYSSLNFGTPNGSHPPTVPDIIISDLLSDNIQNLCWIQSSQSKRQIHGIAHAGHCGTALGAGHGCGFVQRGRFKSAIPISASESLCLLSPPGLILRL